MASLESFAKLRKGDQAAGRGVRNPSTAFIEEPLVSYASLLLCAAALSLPAARRDVRQSQPTFRTSGSFFALSVADIGASSRWYQEKFGMRVILDPPRSADAKVVVLEGGGLLVELIQMDAARPLDAIAPSVRGSLFVHGIAKVGFVVENFDQTLAALRTRGVEISLGPFPKSATQPANVLIVDNAGNRIQIFGR